MGVPSWSLSRAENALADPTIPATSTATARDYITASQGIMAAVRAQADDQGGAIITTGIANAYVATTAAGVEVLRAGLSLVIKLNRTNTDNPTLNVDGTGPRPLLDADGLVFAAGRLKAGRFARVVYDAASAAWLADALSATDNTLDANKPVSTAQAAAIAAVDADGSRTNAKLAPMPSLTVKANTTGASAQPQDVLLSALAAIGNPLGDQIGARAPGYSTRASAIGSAIPAPITALLLEGFATPGDCPAMVVREVTDTGTLQPWQFRTNGSTRRWELTGNDVDVRQLGAIGGLKSATVASCPNDYAALQGALDYIGLTGGRISGPGDRQFRTDTGLIARINRQLPAAAIPPTQDIHFQNNSRFDVVSSGGMVIVAGAAMTTLLSLQFNAALSNLGPFKSKVEGFELRGNGLAQFGFTSDFSMHTIFEGNCLDGFTAGCVNWIGYGVARIYRNVFRGPVCIRFQGGGGDSVIAWNDYFLPNNGKAVWVGALGGNLIVDGGTVNGEGAIGCIGVDISVDGTGTDEIRHVVVQNVEFSGLLYGVRALKSSTVRNIYSLTIKGNHTTPAAGGAVHTGVLAHLTGIDTAQVHHNIANGLRGVLASESAILAFDCDDIHIDHNVIGNFAKPALYFNNVRNSSFNNNKVRDVGRAGASGVIVDIDGATNGTQFNDNTFIQTSSAFAQNGLFERTGATGNEGLRNKWQGVATTGVIASGSTSVFRRHTVPFAEASVTQNATTASATGARNITVSRASIGRTAVTFGTSHGDANYTPKVTGTDCKAQIEGKTATGFTVLMLNLADSPVDSAFEVEVTSRTP